MTLLTKINSKSANIAVIGLGYVGLPLVIEFCRAGFHVTGFDVDEQKIALLLQGKSYIRHIENHLGYHPTHKIEEGLDAALEWYRQNVAINNPA